MKQSGLAAFARMFKHWNYKIWKRGRRALVGSRTLGLFIEGRGNCNEFGQRFRSYLALVCPKCHFWAMMIVYIQFLEIEQYISKKSPRQWSMKTKRSPCQTTPVNTQQLSGHLQTESIPMLFNQENSVNTFVAGSEGRMTAIYFTQNGLTDRFE